MADRMGDIAALDTYGDGDPAAQGLEDFARRIELLQRDPSERWGPDGMNPEDRGYGVSIDQIPNYALDNPSRLQMYQHYYGPYGGIGTPNIPSQEPDPFRGRRT